MAYSGDPSSSGLDAVRFWCQDTGVTPLLSDTEISYVISFLGLNPVTAPIESAAACADRIAAKYAGMVSINADGVSYSGDQLMLKYANLGKELRDTSRRISGEGATPFIGGQSTVGPNFGLGMHDNPEAYSQTLGSPNWDGYNGELAYPPGYDDQVGY